MPEVLTLAAVDRLFHGLHAARGPRAKAPVLSDALGLCSGLEAKYLVKIITGDLRIGLKEGLVEEAVAKGFARDLELVRNTHLLVGDIGETARLAARNELSTASIIPFRPIKFMLASPEETAAELLARVRSWKKPNPSSASSSEPGETHPNDGSGAVGVWLEDKYDGVRCQLHRVGPQVSLYSRDLKDISSTFPELVRAAAALNRGVILDGEIVASRGEQVLPFAELQKRLGRREDDLFMREEIPIRFIAFDLLWKDGAGQLDVPLRQRRAALENLVLHPLIGLSRITPAASEEAIETAFREARARGNEGLMAKDPNSKYTPGRRGLAWLKLKKALATLDCVVIGAEYGHGKRAKVLSDYTFAVRDDNTGELKTIGKAYSGLTDAEIGMLTERFLRSARRQHGRYFEVPPDTVLEIAFDRIQPSTRHSSGLAMRFPRIVKIRDDKTAADIDTVASARRLISMKQPE
jgi:DNA ligase-1